MIVAAIVAVLAWGAAATALRSADGEPLVVPVGGVVVDWAGAVQPQRTTAARATMTAAADKAVRRIADGIIGLLPGFAAGERTLGRWSRRYFAGSHDSVGSWSGGRDGVAAFVQGDGFGELVGALSVGAADDGFSL